MGLKSDSWIREKALKEDMITPFCENLVGEGVVSYGLSSYGYDIRVSDEFKIFTNINAEVVDPKDFNNNNVVDFKGDICIVPPNSFALARTVEYFKMPKDTLAICLGKCLTGDSRVLNADNGSYLPIREFNGVKSTISFDKFQTKKAEILNFIPNGIKKVYKLKTKAGLEIKATSNHPFLQIDGWRELKDLKVGDRIAVARAIPFFGNEDIQDWEASLLGLMISEGQCDTEGFSPAFTTEDEVLAELLIKSVKEGLNCEVTKTPPYSYRIVNRKKRGGIMNTNRATLWLKEYKLNVKSEKKFVPDSIFRAKKESVILFLQTLYSGDGSIYKSKDGKSFHLEYYSNSKRLIEDIHHLLLRFGIFALIRERITEVGTTAYTLQITDKDLIYQFYKKIGFYPNSIKQRRLEEIIVEISKREKSNFDTLPNEAWSIAKEAMSRRGVSFNSLGVKVTPKQSLSLKDAKLIVENTGDENLNSLLQTDSPIWDTVKSIEYIGEEEVFDLEVPNYHNFIANDIVVHNSTYARCGIIVNVTPFEPEFEGHITIEISNTTPLPAKIYANEGIAQVLFLQGDEQCETTYGDRKGKYQKQKGITLPKILKDS